MVTLKDIADDKTTISSTRWGFALTLIVDVIVINIVIIAGLVGHFINVPIPDTFYKSVALLLGVLTGITGTTKLAQGFEPQHKNKDKEEIKWNG